MIVDEASMLSTDDLDALVAVGGQRCWRLVCVGDPEQLPAVQRGGMFAYWSDHIPTIRLDEIRRFTDGWQAEASLALRRGDPAGAEAYAAHRRVRGHPLGSRR